MGKLRPRYNAKARASSHTTKTAKPHPNARDGGIEALRKKLKSKVNIDRTAPKTVVSKPDPACDQPLNVVVAETPDPNREVIDEKSQTGNVGLEEILAKLPEPPEGKVSRTKKKRLEKFIVGTRILLYETHQISYLHLGKTTEEGGTS